MRTERKSKGGVVLVLAILACVALYAVWTYPRTRTVPPDPAQAEYARMIGFPVALTNTLEMTLRLIPSGVYARGSPPNERGRRDEEVPHSVRISVPFYLAATEVTQEQFEAVMGRNPSFFRGRAHLPVEYVSWEDAIQFCNRLSEKEGHEPVYEMRDGVWRILVHRNGYRLPTEAEWEFACRAGTETPFYTGRANPIPIGRDNAWRAAWHRHNARGRTHHVGLREPNAWGLYDMLGNVWEWCWDWHGPYPRASDPLPHGPEQGTLRVIRGGGWYSPTYETRCAMRKGRNPAMPWNSLGFRVALNIPPDSLRARPSKP